MEVVLWDGGLQEQEIIAIEKIKRAFSAKKNTPKTLPQGGSLQDQLQSVVGRNYSGMFPWKGYAGFRFVDSKNHDGEFDLVIVTHCNVIIVELKDWNHQQITARRDRWYKGDKDMGRSPVSVTRNKKFTLDNKLKKLRQKFTNRGYTPFVEFFIVMTGNSDFSLLPESDASHTMSLDDFLKFSDEKVFNQRFRPHPSSKVLQKDISLFDEMLLGKQTQAKSICVEGYTALETIFEHPKGIYKEFLAKAESSASSEALMRGWQFNKIEGTKAKTADGRAEIVSREREVLQHINHHNRDLYNHCLRSLTSFQKMK